MKEKIPVLIDTDIGDDIDDAFALCLAMRSPEIRLLGVTTVHRCAKHRARMAKALLRAGGFGYVPVHAGDSRPLKCTSVYGRPIDYADLPHSYDSEYDDVSYDGDDAVSFLAETLKKSSDKVTIVTLGALTNLARLLCEHPEVHEKIGLTCTMGGAYSMNWGEYNFCCDPEAAAVVLESGLPQHCVGVDVTFQCKLNGELLEQSVRSPIPACKC